MSAANALHAPMRSQMRKPAASRDRAKEAENRHKSKIAKSAKVKGYSFGKRQR